MGFDVDGTTLLKDQQDSFIKRLNDGLENLSISEKPGVYAEKKTIASEELKQIRSHCWNMVEKFKTSQPREVFINNMKGKLGEELVQRCLGDLVSPVKYEVIPESGDGKIDLVAEFDHTIAIQVKTRYSSVNEARWYISYDEIAKNKAIVCILIYKNYNGVEDFDEFRAEYIPVMAGFLPTDSIHKMIDKNEIKLEAKNGNKIVELRIGDLLYGIGLESYLKGIVDDPIRYIKAGNLCAERGDYQKATENYTKAINKAININPTPNCCAEAYERRSIAYFKLGNDKGAIEDLQEAHRLYLDQENKVAAERVNKAIAKQALSKVSTQGSSSSSSPPFCGNNNTSFECKYLHTLEGHSKSVCSIAASRDGQILVSGSTDSTIKLWNPHTGELIHTLCNHSHIVNSVTISPDGQRLISGSEDKTIKLWNLHTKEPIHIICNTHKVYGVAVSHDGNTIASGSSDNKVKLWNQDSGELFKTFSQHGGNVFSVAFSPDNQFLASSSSDKRIIIWNLMNGQYYRTSPLDYFIRSIAISSDGKILVSGSDDGKIQVWNLDNGQLQLRHTLTEHLDNTHSPHTSPAVAISLDGKVLASGAKEQKIQLWNLHTGELLHTLSGHSGTILSIAFVGFDGRILASGSADNTIKIWQLG